MKKNKPEWRIVHVENDDLFGKSYYKIEHLGPLKLRYHTYYFPIHYKYFDDREFRFHTYEEAKQEIDKLVQGLSNYCYCEKVVYEIIPEEEK